MALDETDQGCGATWASAFCVLPSAFAFEGRCPASGTDPLCGDITNPQSRHGESSRLGATLNRYAYALNNPTTLTDPLGLFEPVPGGCSTDWSGFGYICPGEIFLDLVRSFGYCALFGTCDYYLGGGVIHVTSYSTPASPPKPAPPGKGCTQGISPAQGQQILNSSQKFFGIPYNQQVCNQFVCNSINASGIVPGQKISVTTTTISSSPSFAPVPASQAQAGDVIVFSGPPRHMGFNVPQPPSPNQIIDTFLSATVHGGNNNLGGARYLPPTRRYFPGTQTVYRLQVPCHE